MSQVVGGGANLFISPGPQNAQGWIVTWNNGGWQGNSIIEAQPLNTGAALSYSEGPVSLNNNGTYSFDVTITDQGPNNTFYNLQISAS